MNDRLHLVLLRAASLLAPVGERAEWMAEWRAELWYVGRNRRTAFCLGAFRDAFWMRRNSPPPVYFQSPWECLAVLAVLAGLSVFFAFRLPLPHEMLFSRPLPKGLATITGIPVDDYRQLPGDSSNFAFCGPARLSGGKFAVALASRNLFDLLQVPVAATGDTQTAPLVITLSAWHRTFASDPHIVGLRLMVAGRQARVAAILPDLVWRLPGSADAWLLVDDPSLAAESRGYVLAQVSSSTRRISVVREDGAVHQFVCVPLSEPRFLVILLLVMGVSGALLPAVTNMSLGEYPANLHTPSRGTALRRWVFLTAKIALVLPIVLFGSLDILSLVAVQIMGHGLVVSSVLGFRWVLIDQRRRCPVCLRVLTNPTSIGVPSRTLLEWYGTELMCGKGHGLLHVPEIRNSYSEQRWLHLDSSWVVCFSC